MICAVLTFSGSISVCHFDCCCSEEKTAIKKAIVERKIYKDATKARHVLNCAMKFHLMLSHRFKFTILLLCLRSTMSHPTYQMNKSMYIWYPSSKLSAMLLLNIIRFNKSTELLSQCSECCHKNSVCDVESNLSLILFSVYFSLDKNFSRWWGFVHVPKLLPKKSEKNKTIIYDEAHQATRVLEEEKVSLDDEMENELFRVHRLIKSDVLSKAKLLE